LGIARFAGSSLAEADLTTRKRHQAHRPSSTFTSLTTTMPLPTHPAVPVVTRRFFLRAAGVSLALPLFESLSTRVLGAGLGVAGKAGAATGASRPARMVAIGNLFGFYGPEFFPKTPGRDYELLKLLQPLAPHREDFTVYSGLDHGLRGGHYTIHTFLSGVRQSDAKSMPDGNITVDQRAAETVGGVTRFSSLAVGPEDGLQGEGRGCMMCWTRSGTHVPPTATAKELFHKLFSTDAADGRERELDRFARHGSILDAVNSNAKSLSRQLGKRDQEKLDEYFTSVRDVEKQIELRRRWAGLPKPKPEMPEPPNADFPSDLPVLYDLIALALQTDSTRIATLEIGGQFMERNFGLKKGYHGYSHHGHLQENIDGLLTLEGYQMQQFARFLAKLKSIQDGEGNLLDHTMVVIGSGMGNANAHTNNNLPVIFAGGGFKHGEHRMYPESGLGRVPLCNLYLSMLQRFGVEVDKFGTSTGTMRDLERARA